MSVKDLRVAIIGYNFMGKAHSNAFRDVGIYFNDLRLKPVMKAICGRNEKAVKAAQRTYGWESYETDATRLIKRADIDVVDVASTGSAHKEQVIAAARALVCSAIAASARAYRDAYL